MNWPRCRPQPQRHHLSRNQRKARLSRTNGNSHRRARLKAGSEAGKDDGHQDAPAIRGSKHLNSLGITFGAQYEREMAPPGPRPTHSTEAKFAPRRSTTLGDAAKVIDTSEHLRAIRAEGRTIAVIGRPCELLLLTSNLMVRTSGAPAHRSKKHERLQILIRIFRKRPVSTSD